MAMVKIHHAFKEHRFQSKMILQVHDELVFDVVKEEVEKVKPVILDCMQSAMTLPNGIPILAEVGVGDNWLEAH
jgi:DNA polymerase-1